MPSGWPALCAVSSFLWLSHSLEEHQVIEHPRLSTLLVLLIAAISSYAASLCAAWLPGTNGRFTDESGPLKVKRTNLHKKPRRYFLPGLIVCIIFRLEIFHRVTLDLPCSKPGIEAFLPLLILLYELLPGRRVRVGANDDEDKDADDPGMTVFDALGRWFTESKGSLSIGILMLTWGTYFASSHGPRSTIFCSSHDWPTLVVLLQWAGLILDASIIITVWRVLAWARTTKTRLRTLSGILFAASFGTASLYWVFRLFLPAKPMNYNFRGLDSLYLFDVVVDGLAFSVCLVSTSLLAPEESPLSLSGTVAFLFGLSEAVQKTKLTGTWENTSPAATYFALTFVCVGFSHFVYANNIRSVVFVHRAFVVFLLVLVTIVATIYTPIKALQVTDQHPLFKIIYDARVEADRWLIYATVSDSVPMGIQEYKERHNGKKPPPKFDVWYNFAKERRSVFLDHFPQIQNDLLPFWGVTPSKIREDVRRAATEPNMALLQIQAGKCLHNLPSASPHSAVMDGLVDLVKGFAEHLADMELAINLEERPRVLAPWDDIQRFTKTANRKRVSKLLPRGSGWLNEMPVAQSMANDKMQAPDSVTPVRAVREMTALACPPGTRARAGTHWDIRGFCTFCARPQSQGQSLIDWPLSQEICHQSDLLRLHSLYMTPAERLPLQELLPVFSRAKTDSYSDILLPLPRAGEEAADSNTEGFDMKLKKLFWRGEVDRLGASHELVRGGHQDRLVHSLNTAARSDKTTLMLPISKGSYAFEQAPTADLNELLPIDVAFSEYTTCQPGSDSSSSTCEAVDAYLAKKPSDEKALRSQYVMVVDADSSPPPELLSTLRSSSVPFYASIFREWYSDRLRPWVHFVPVDLRFHALHGTLAYFVGMQTRDGRKLNGRHVDMEGRPKDGKWIAEEGKRWAGRVLRREDIEVYLFRLLLEWGRVVDDNREELGFELVV
ncbi:glycosyltransferase family 90 protein [Parathielavia hyrcaniae]|uniref:Glycosyltransferase family 90 protein n=1 Tax=Parathielavia hyrcaniae TaxID=113614 RepID=A0AAN6T655_9PEZI|nr:glycosyltransferase family 90 protein [Parathielavia hyrcaniae]